MACGKVKNYDGFLWSLRDITYTCHTEYSNKNGAFHGFFVSWKIYNQFWTSLHEITTKCQVITNKSLGFFEKLVAPLLVCVGVENVYLDGGCLKEKNFYLLNLLQTVQGNI